MPLIGVNTVVQKANYEEEKEFRHSWSGLADWTRLVRCDERAVAGLAPWDRKPDLRRQYPCPDIFESLFVMSNGRLALCCYDYDGVFSLGDLNKETIEEAWNSEEYRNIRQAHREGRGNSIKLCHDINCSRISKEGAYRWWF